jgi:hypothetical protein
MLEGPNGTLDGLMCFYMFPPVKISHNCVGLNTTVNTGAKTKVEITQSLPSLNQELKLTEFVQFLK